MTHVSREKSVVPRKIANPHRNAEKMGRMEEMVWTARTEKMGNMVATESMAVTGKTAVMGKTG
jgi:hypothetical protein